MALTPDERAAENAGFIMPEGTSLISDGDDAIRNNAKVAHQLLGTKADDNTVNAYRGELTATDDLDALRGHPSWGTYRLAGDAAEANGFGYTAGTFIVLPAGGMTGVTAENTVQRWEPLEGRPLRRTLDAYGVWSEWDHSGWHRGAVAAGSDLNDFITPGAWSVDGRLAIANMPPDLIGSPFTLEVMKIGGSWTKQIATDENNRRRFRNHTGTTWAAVGAWNTEATGGGAAGLAGVEATGEWTSLSEELALLKQLGEHREAEYFEVGRSVQNRVIPGIRIGFATETDGSPRPTVLVTAGVHGNERGTREGALRLVRELIQADTLARFRLGVIVIPNVNPDGFAAWSRSNANVVNLNRDFIDATQPETQAVRALVERENIIGAVDLHGGGQGLRINFVEPDDTRHTIKPAVMERSHRMFDAVWEYVLDHDEEPWRYPFIDGSEGEGLVGTFHNGIAADYDVPSLLLELPFISMIDRDDRRLPPRVWMAYAGAMFVHGAIDVISRERQAFQAVSRSQSYTIPDRHRGQLELARAASRDTGEVELTSLFPQLTNGRVYARKVGSEAEVTLADIEFGTSTPPEFFYIEGLLPEDFRPTTLKSFTALADLTGSVTRRVRFQPDGRILLYDITPTTRINVVASYRTADHGPTT